MRVPGADQHGPQKPRRSIVVMAAAILLVSAGACTSASDSPAPATPSSAPANTASVLPTSTSSSPPTRSGDATSPRWVEGEGPGVPAVTDPGVGQEFYVFGWSKGYLGFTSAYTTATGKMQSLRVTSSADGVHWRETGRLGLGSGDVPVVVTHVVEGPSGLLATAEQVGCAWQKPAIRMWRSTDGVSWTSVDIKSVFGAESLPSVSGGSAGYIVLAATTRLRTLWTSPDGASWHRSAVPGGGFIARSVASFRGGFILAGKTQVAPPDCGATTDGTAPHYTGSVWFSADGTPWTAAVLPGVLSGADTTMSVYRLNDATVLVEEVATTEAMPNGEVRDWISSDGRTWQPTDTLRASLGLAVTDGARTMFVRSTDQGDPEIWALMDDLRPMRLSTGTDVPISDRYGLVALGPAGLVVTDPSGATSWLWVSAP